MSFLISFQRKPGTPSASGLPVMNTECLRKAYGIQKQEQWMLHKCLREGHTLYDPVLCELPPHVSRQRQLCSFSGSVFSFCMSCLFPSPSNHSHSLSLIPLFHCTAASWPAGLDMSTFLSSTKRRCFPLSSPSLSPTSCQDL